MDATTKVDVEVEATNATKVSLYAFSVEVPRGPTYQQIKHAALSRAAKLDRTATKLRVISWRYSYDRETVAVERE